MTPFYTINRLDIGESGRFPRTIIGPIEMGGCRHLLPFFAALVACKKDS